MSMSDAKGGATSWATVALCFLVAVFEGIDLQAAGVAAPKLIPTFGLAPGVLGLFLSASTIGLIVGSAVGGRLADVIGRKSTLILSMALFGLFAVANGFAPNVEVLMATRFLTGVGLGGALPNLLALASENTAPSRRGIAIGVLYAGMPMGGALASLISLLGATTDWRLVFFIGGAAPLVTIPLLAALLPDSHELQAVKASGQGRLKPMSIATALFGEGRATRTALIWVACVLALMTHYLLLNWLPTLMIGRGLSRPDVAWVQLTLNIFIALGAVSMGWALSRLPLAVATLGAYCLAAVGLTTLWLAPVSMPISILVGAFVGFALAGAQTMLYVLPPPNYPTEGRGTGIGAAVAAGRVGATTGPILAGVLLGAGGAPQQVLMWLVPVILVAGAAAFTLSLLMQSGRKLREAAAH